MTVIQRSDVTRIRAKYLEQAPVEAQTRVEAPAPKPVGDAFDPVTTPASKPTPGGKLLWTDAAVEAQRNHGQEQGGLSPEQAETNRSLASQLDPAVQVDAQVLSLIAAEAGIAAERQDPNQLAAAAAYVGRATSPEDQQGRLAKALDNLAVLDTIGAPKLPEKEFVELMWDAARIPGHAIDKLPADRQAKAYQTLAGALDTPGQHQLKIEKYDVKVAVDGTGAVTDSSTKKPSKWKLVGKIALNVGLGVAAAFTGGAALVAVKAVQLGMAAYNGIKSAAKGDWMGAVTGFAGAFAGGTAAATGAASTATRVATSVARGASAAQGAVVAVKTRSVAGMLGAAAEGLGAASSFAPNSAGLTRAVNATTRTAQGAAVAESAARGNLTGAAGAALSLGAGGNAARSKLVERIVGATSAAAAGARGDWTAALQAGTALAADFTKNGKLEEASRLLSGVRAAQLAQKSGDWALAAQEVASLGQAARQLVSKQPQPLQARSLAGVAQLAPAVTGTDVSGPAPLEARSLIGIAALAPSVRGTSLQQAATPAKPKPSQQVKELQNALRSVGLDVKADGVMGAKTEAALRQFQKENGLKVTGVLDGATVQALGAERDVVTVAAPLTAPPKLNTTGAAERFKLGLAKAEVGLRLDKEQWMAQELLRTGSRGNTVAHAAERYLEQIAYARKELAAAKNPYEIEASLYSMRAPARNLQNFITNEKNLNRDLLQVGKWWLSTAAQTATWFCPPLALPLAGVDVAADFLSREGSVKERLVAMGTDGLKDYLIGKITDRFGGAVAKQLGGHLTEETLELMKDRLEKGLEVNDMLQEFMGLSSSEK